ncbi:MAG: PhzF family phenazine biosynthesis protein [Xanthomonadales bacterium]
MVEMKRLPIFQVDAFAAAPFTGNPAAVVPLEQWLDDELMQSIALENNLSETAFFVNEGDAYRIRWFTPAAEVDLCGHATLASAWVLFNELGHTAETIRFLSRSGDLHVSRDGAWLTLDFPAQPPVPVARSPELVRGLGRAPSELLAAEDYLAVFDDAGQVAALRPDFELLARLDRRGVIATAPSDEVDFVTRFFAPGLAVPEDPVTGSAFTQLGPYWAERLGRARLHARQISARGGEVICEPRGERVLISGRASAYLAGTITV